jgi:hypothetical protein
MNRTDKKAMVATLAVAALAILLLLSGTSGVVSPPAAAAATAVGPSPTDCNNVYAVNVTNATVSYGGNVYSPFDDPNETITMTYGSYYEVSLQGSVAPRSYSSSTNSGSLWYSTTSMGNETSQVCTAALFTPNVGYVLKDYETTGFSIGPQGGLQSVAYVLFNGCYEGRCGHYVYSDPTIWFKIDWLPQNYTGHTVVTTTTTTATATLMNTSTRISTVTSTSTKPASTTTQTATSIVTSTPPASTTTMTDTVTSLATTVVTSSVTTTSTTESINTTAEYGLGIVVAIVGVSVVAITVLRLQHEAAYRKVSSSS